MVYLQQKMHSVVKSQAVVLLLDSLNQVMAFMMFVKCWAKTPRCECVYKEGGYMGESRESERQKA